MKSKIALSLLGLFVAAGCFGIDTDVKKFFGAPATVKPAPGKIYPKGAQLPYALPGKGNVTAEALQRTPYRPLALNAGADIGRLAWRQATGEANSVAVIRLDSLPEGASARYDIYTALQSGARGICLLPAASLLSAAAGKTYIDEAVKTMEELNGSAALTAALTAGSPRNTITLTITEGPPTVTGPDGKNYPSLALRDVVYDACRYVVLTNAAASPVEVMVGGLVYGSGITVEELFSANDKFIAPEADFGTKLNPREVKIFKIYNAAR